MNSSTEPPIVQKKGNINKCPSCGAQVGAFASSCESCGHEFSEIAANKTIASLVARFDAIEKEADENTTLSASRSEKIIVDKRARVIRDFPIPNSREDLQQLLYFIQPKLMDGLKPDPNIEDWRTKFNEVLSRAKNAYKNNASALADFTQIENSLRNTFSESIIIKAKRNTLFVALLSGIFVLGLFVMINMLIERYKSSQCEEKYTKTANLEQVRLDSLLAGAEQNLKNKQYPEALAASAKLHWELQDTECKIENNNKSRDMWNGKREQFEVSAKSQTNAASAEISAAANQAISEKQIEADKVTALAKIEADKVAAKAAVVKDKVRAKVDAAEKVESDKKW